MAASAIADEFSTRGEADPAYDSDETFFEPDLGKHQDEARQLSQNTEDVDSYFERMYNKYAPPDLGAFRARAPFAEPNDLNDGRVSPEAHGLGQGRAPDADTDETFFDPGHEDQKYHGHRQHQEQPLPDSDETFFEPADDGGLRTANEGFAQNRQGGTQGRRGSPADSGAGSSRSWGRCSPLLDSDAVADFFRHDEHYVEDVLRAVHDRLDDAAASEGLFTHGLEWSECWERDEHPRRADDSAHHDNNGADQDQEHDLYVQLQDPMTQEMRTFLVPGVRGNAESLRLLTQDLGWTQHLTEHEPPEPEDYPDCPMRSQSEPLGQEMDVPSADWTPMAAQEQQDHSMDGSHWPAHAQEAMSQDGDGVVASRGRSCGGPSQRIVPDVQPMSTDCSIADGRLVPTSTPFLRGKSFGSSDSSDAQMVPSIPSFDEEPLAPLAPLSPVAWCALREDQAKMEEIVKSLNSISFNAEIGAAAASVVEVAGDGGPPPDAAAVPVQMARCAPAAPAPSPAQTQPTSSPTFSITSFKRGRRGRPRARARPGPGDPRQSQSAATSTSITGSTARRMPAKRKRPGAGGSQLKRSQSQSFTCSPSSPPRQRARTSGGVQSAPSKGRPEAFKACYRLQELRFLMQDILGGREPFPAPHDVSMMRQEVLSIVNNMRQIAKSGSLNRGKLKLKCEEAWQVADKLLHQLNVFSEFQESCSLTDDCAQTAVASGDAAPQGLAASMPQNDIGELCLGEEEKDAPQVSSQLLFNPNQQIKARGKKRGKKKTANLEKIGQTSQDNRHEVLPGENLDLLASCIYSEHGGPSKNSDSIQTQNALGAVLESIHYENNELSQEISNLEIDQNCTSRNMQNDPCPQPVTVSELPQTKSVVQDKVVNNCNLNQPLETDNFKLKSTMDSSMNCGNEKALETAGANESNDKNLAEQTEFNLLISLIKKSCISRCQDHTWKGGPLTLTGVLLPKQSEFEPIDNLPCNFGENPQAPAPQSWISLLPWDD